MKMKKKKKKKHPVRKEEFLYRMRDANDTDGE